MDKIEAIKKVKEYSILLKQHLNYEEIYLFGSYAKNTNNADSDIDVAIIVNKLDDDYFTVNPLLWKIRREVDDRIEPILLEKEFDDADFIGDIKSYGIEIH